MFFPAFDIIIEIIVVAIFILVIYTIASEKIHRALIALIGAAIVYIILMFSGKVTILEIIGFAFGTSQDGFTNFHSILLIFGMMLIVEVCNSAGVFQFIAFFLVQKARGNSTVILILICVLSAIMSAILNNILTVIILIPLIIQISRILNIDPEKYIISAAILVNVGGLFFQISSIPNILITNYFQISFAEFLINVGFFSMIILGISIMLFVIAFRKSLKVPEDRLVKYLREIDPWNFVSSKKLFFEASIILIIVITLFILPMKEITFGILSTDIIALIGGVTLLIISRLDARETLKKIDFSLIIYLLAIFIVVGGLEAVGLVAQVAAAMLGIQAFFGNTPLVTVLLTLWLSAGLSSIVDNIPITQTLIPTIGLVTQGYPHFIARQTQYSLAFGANLGDNLTPMGDNILVMNIAEENGRPITQKQFFRIGFITTIIQLMIVTMFYIYLLEIILGIILTIFIASITGIILYLYYLNKKKSIFRSFFDLFSTFWSNIKISLKKITKRKGENDDTIKLGKN
ncbi:MAG: SLC13 family permease [Candidatus Helarchaeota archaeon]